MRKLLIGIQTFEKIREGGGYRADAVVTVPDAVYVFAFKLNGSVGGALKQIDERGYLIP